MKRKHVLAFFFSFALLLLAACGANEKTTKDTPKETQKETVELNISAAASLKGAMADLQKAFQKSHSEVKFVNNFGSSGTLAQQIQQGAPADVFLSADQKWMNTLADGKLIKDDTRKDFSGNKIVLITEKDSDLAIKSFNDIKADAIGQVAIGDPKSVPAGTYTKEALEKINKWKELEKHFVFGSDVVQTLTYVESGNTDIGFVYSSDASTSDKVKVLAEADSAWHKPIIYPAAVLNESKNPDEATEFVNFLLTDEAQEILSKYGFKK
ncbi:molybdate ABC transporter substrate-binding protein [Niallia sp. 01092]|uniref:molybdate ABC transporter substrate-binding protein n=1 Tax=unclassified Niallia TaxID=2837522 RepID=UPI003FD1C7E1